MIERAQDKPKAPRTGSLVGPNADLPYRVELCEAGNPDLVERVLARALSASLARAIFKAAQADHPDRRITLRRGARLLADSAE